MRYYLLPFLVFLFLSCKKNKDEGPKCRFKTISHRSGNVHHVTYRGDTLMIMGEYTVGGNFYFSTADRLQRIESPATNPYILTELVYNNNGKIVEAKTYFAGTNTWVYQGKAVFTYTNNKLTNRREESTTYPSGPFYNTDLVWEEDNIRTIITRIGTDTICVKVISYDMSKTNPMTRYDYLYFGDGDADYGGYKLPYYFSKNLMTNVESKCGVADTRIYTYTFNGNGLIEKVLDNGDMLWTYEYDCK